MKYGIFYGSTTGVTAGVARELADRLEIGEADVHDVASTEPSAVAPYDVLLLGSSTWGDGDLQDDFEDFLTGLKALTLKGKKVAIFGCGDETMADTFCNAVGRIYDALQPTGAEFIGFTPDTSYSYHHTDAQRGDHLVGLLLDNVNHADLTPGRIEAWAAELRDQAAR